MKDIPQLVARLNANPSEEGAWVDIFLAAIRQRELALALKVLNARHHQRADGATFAHNRLFDLLAGGGADVAWLAGEAPRDTPFLPIFLYAHGLAILMNWQLDEGAAVLRKAAFYASQTVATVFRADAQFGGAIIGRMLQQANLLEPSTYRPARRLAAPSVNLPDRLPAKPGPLLVACCDQVYLKAYGERFLSSLQAACPDAGALINVINPTDGDELTTDLARRFDNVAFATESGPAFPAYYASDRFLIAGHIIDRYGKDLLLSDIDTEFPERFSDVAAAAGKPSVAYIGRADIVEPVLYIHACLVGVKATGDARIFLETVSTYLQGKLAAENPIWTVDQIALFRAKCIHGTLDIGNINETLPPDLQLPQFLKAGHILRHADLSSSRGGDLNYDIHFDEEFRPIMTVKSPVMPTAD